MFVKNLFKTIYLIIFCFQNAKAIDIEKYNNQKSIYKGENIHGVIRHIDSDSIFLTFDFCQTGFDEKLINFLIKENIPATLFMTKTWINNNLIFAEKLAKKPFFSIQNHGTKHMPCFADGSSVYGIQGTKNPKQIVDEIEHGSQEIFKLTQKKPSFYRSGTAYYDNICIDIAADLGYKIAGFNINGDAGATYNSDKVYSMIIKARPGDIVILHGNKPKSGTRAGVIRAITEMKKNKITFKILP